MNVGVIRACITFFCGLIMEDHVAGFQIAEQPPTIRTGMGISIIASSTVRSEEYVRSYPDDTEHRARKLHCIPAPSPSCQ